MTDLPADDGWLEPAEAERLDRFSYTKRRDEARLGRWTAKRAVAHALRLDDRPEVLRGLVIRNAPGGAPEVIIDGRSAPVSITMTDRADWAVCTVIGGQQPIGCDLELVEPRTAAFIADYFTTDEQRLFDDDRFDHDLLANLIWSAKESALKVLRTGLRRDTRSVEVELAAEPNDDGWSALYVSAVEGLAFTGSWRRFGDFVLTYVSHSKTPSPASLIDPSPLHDAAPSHRWMVQPRRR